MKTHLIGTLATTTLLALGACASPDNQREQIVRCAAYMENMPTTSFDGQMQFAEEVQTLLQQDDTVEDRDAGLLYQAAAQYSEDIDVARAAALEQEAREDLRQHFANNDARASADYVEACVRTFKDLGRG